MPRRSWTSSTTSRGSRAKRSWRRRERSEARSKTRPSMITEPAVSSGSNAIRPGSVAFDHGQAATLLGLRNSSSCREITIGPSSVEPCWRPSRWWSWWPKGRGVCAVGRTPPPCLRSTKRGQTPQPCGGGVERVLARHTEGFQGGLARDLPSRLRAVLSWPGRRADLPTSPRGSGARQHGADAEGNMPHLWVGVRQGAREHAEEAIRGWTELGHD